MLAAHILGQLLAYLSRAVPAPGPIPQNEPLAVAASAHVNAAAEGASVPAENTHTTFNHHGKPEARPPPAKRPCCDNQDSTGGPAQATMEDHEQTPLAASIDAATPAKRPEPDMDSRAAADAAVTPPRGDGSGSGTAATPARLNTYLSPSAALRLSQSCRKSPLSEPSFAAHPDGLPPQAVSKQRQLATVIRVAETRLLGAAKAQVRKLYEHVKQKCAETGDNDYTPPARVGVETNPWYNLMHYVRGKSFKLAVHDFQLLALLPRPQRIIDPERFGAVEECVGGWRWTFEAAKVNQCSEVFASLPAAEEALRWIQLELYLIWQIKEERAAHLQNLIQRQRSKQQLAALAAKPSLASLRERIVEEAASTTGTAVVTEQPSPRLDPRLARGFANLGNTCYLNAATQCLLHCRPFRQDLESQIDGASFAGDRLKALLNEYKREQATQIDVTALLAAWVDRVLSQAGFAAGTQQDAAECLMHILLSVDQGNMQRRVCGANAAASVESMILCEIADEAQVPDLL